MRLRRSSAASISTHHESWSVINPGPMTLGSPKVQCTFRARPIGEHPNAEGDTAVLYRSLVSGSSFPNPTGGRRSPLRSHAGV